LDIANVSEKLMATLQATPFSGPDNALVHLYFSSHFLKDLQNSRLRFC